MPPSRTAWSASVDNCDRLWPSTSRRNLETILEAIRHLEGDPNVVAARRDDAVAQLIAPNSLSLMASGKACVAVFSS